MARPGLRSKPATPQWQPSRSLGAGLTFGCIFTTSGATHRNIAARGVSDVTLISASMVGGAYGPTAQFGTGTYARAPRSPATQPTGGYTVAALVRSNGTPGGALPIMLCASVGAVDAAWYLGVNGGRPEFARRNLSGTYQSALSASYTWGSDYHLFAGTVVPANATDTAGALTLHANGARIAAGTYSAAQYAYTASPLLVGSLYDTTTNSATAWPGDIAAVYIWCRPLSDAEHAALAADPFAPVRPQPRAWLPAAVSFAGTLAAAADAASSALAGTVAVPGTLGATAQAATTSAAAAVATAGTLAATADAATTSLGAALAISAAAAMTAGAASTSLTSLSLAPVHVTLAAAAGYATTGLSGGTVLRLINWDAVADTDLTNPFEIDPDATTDDTI